MVNTGCLNKHAQAGLAHLLAYALAHFRFVTMHMAIGAGGFIGTEGTFLNAQ